VSAEEFLTNTEDNPYQELLDQRTEQPQYQSRLSPVRNHRDAGNGMPRAMPEHIVPPQFGHLQANNTGVRITVNDESDDIVNQELPPSNRFVSTAGWDGSDS